MIAGLRLAENTTAESVLARHISEREVDDDSAFALAGEPFIVSGHGFFSHLKSFTKFRGTRTTR
jgi:hypothetical protein